jgi:tetratricopeptide (TPR) repeat protein
MIDILNKNYLSAARIILLGGVVSLLNVTTAFAVTNTEPVSKTTDAADSSSDNLVLDNNENQEDTKEQAPAESSTEIKNPVTAEDLKNLQAARKSHSEQKIIAATSEILNKDSKNIFALNALGVYYFEVKKFGMAKLIFNRALADHKDEPGLYNNLGIVYLAQNEMGLAILNFQKSIKAKENYRIGATNLSSIYLKFHDYQRSIEPLEYAYKATRSDLGREDVAVDIANNYAVALVGLDENRRAGNVFEEIMNTNSKAVEPLLNYAIFLVMVQKNKKDAIRVISKLKFRTEDSKILNRVNELEKKLE